MKYLWISLLVLSACASRNESMLPLGSSTPAHDAGALPNEKANIGINLSPVNYYATQAPFADLFRNRDDWMSTDGAAWDTGMAASIPSDADGYPLSLPVRGQYFRASAFLPFKAGNFELTWQGDGEVTVQAADLNVTASLPGSLKFSLGRSMIDSVFVRIESSQASDHVRGIQIHADAPYDSNFLTSLAGFHVLRFMDWGGTNNSVIQHWSDRTTPQQGQGTVRGVAIETMVDTANAAHANMWFNVPHQADDDFIKQAATLIQARLSPELKVYVEYSNENWNGIFLQAAWEQARGVEAGLDQIGASSDDDSDSTMYAAGLRYSIRRAAATHNIFRGLLGRTRVIAVVAGQSASPSLNEQLLSMYEDQRINPLGGHPDALAVAPYFGEIYREPSDANRTLEQILADAEASLQESVAKATRDNRELADAHGVALIAYEAGQHLLALEGLENDKGFVDRLTAANRSPKMSELYLKAQRLWTDNGGELAVYFSSCQTPSKFGAWGVLEYQDQPASEAPKWSALHALTQGSP